MKKPWLFPLIAALLTTIGLGPARALAAPPPASKPSKPVAVLGFSGYNELKADVGYIGRLSDNPELGLALEVLLKLALQNRGLEGLDKERPWGVVVQLDEEKFAQGVRKPEEALRAFGVVPVSDLKALLSILEPFVGTAHQIEDGLYEVRKKNEGKTAEDAKPFFVKEVDGWAFLANEPKNLAQTPADPGQLLADLTESYDLALRLDLGSVPQELRARLLAEMQEKAQAELEKHKASLSPEEYAVRKILSQQALHAVGRGLDDLADLTVGWTLDNQAGKTYLDVTLTARPGTRTARSLASLGNARSQFAGFLLPEATFQANWTIQFSQPGAVETLALLGLIRQRALREIDKQPPGQATVAAKLLDGLFDVVQGTVEAGRIDGGLAAILDPELVTVVAGGFVADGKKLDATLKELLDAVSQEHPEVAGVVDWEAGEHKGVKFHAAFIPISPDSEERPLFGDVFEVVVATGDQSVYFGVGREPTKVLKRVVDKSAELSAEPVPPLRALLDLGALMKFAAVAGKTEQERQEAAGMATLLEKAGQQDHVNLVARPVENGVQLHLELEEGILKALGALSANGGLPADK